MNLVKMLLKLLALAQEVDHIRSASEALDELIRLVKVAKHYEAAVQIPTETSATGQAAH